MKKTQQLLRERFQQLAGIRPLYEQKAGLDYVSTLIMGFQESFGGLLDMAVDLLKNHEAQKTPAEYDKMIGGDIERDPAWSTLKDQLQGKELYMYFLFKSSGHQNIQAELPFGKDGDVEQVINYYIERISEEDFDANELAQKFDPKINVKELGSGDLKQDRDILLQLITIGNGIDWPNEAPVSKEEMYKELSKGTLNSASYKASTSASEE